MADETNSTPQEVELGNLITRSIGKLGSSIHTQVNGGTVTLSGVADDYAIKRSISDLVKEIGGVHQVVNNIRVAYPTSGYS